MVYVDTSVIVALIVPEPRSAAILTWYDRTRSMLASSAWCVTEFANALGIKQRTRQIDSPTAHGAWRRFERLVTNDLSLLPVPAGAFHRAAALALEAPNALRAGDALHLACAELAGAASLATLDVALARNARRLKMKPLEFS